MQSLSPNSLPIAAHLPNILQLIQQHPVTVVSGSTGCGKSTQVPKALHLALPKARIAVCQPRRVAATSLAVRVSEELGSKLGSVVGYHIGLQSFKSQHCSIVYMTYGILIQELLFQPALPYSHIFLDEIHERSLEMDFTFVALKQLANRLKDKETANPKIVVMSATLNSQLFANYFSTHEQTGLFFLPTLEAGEKEEGTSRGRRGGRPKQNFTLSSMSSSFRPAATYLIPESGKFKIDEHFWEGSALFESSQEQPRLNDNLVGEAMKILSNLTPEQKQGDILFFLPGFFEIQMVKRRLIEAQCAEQRIVEVHSVFSEELYEKLFESKVKNKLILATNIGESSITLPFCRVVIDFCLTKRQALRQRGITQLETKFASKASLTQRAGRVGRVADGTVFRMITRDLYETLPQYEEPQIKCITLEMVILRAKQLDAANKSQIFKDPYQFLAAVMQPPAIETVRNSIEHLLEEEALVGEGASIEEAPSLQMTKIGEFMVSMPCDLQVSKLIMMGIKLRIPGLAIAVASICMATKMFYSHQERRSNIEQFLHALVGYDAGLGNDFLLRERAYNHWKQKFYYPAKEKKLYQKRTRPGKEKEVKSSPKGRIYETSLDLEQEELFSFLQEFAQERWSQREKDFCFPRGLSLNTLREIVKIEENLRCRIANLGVQLQEKGKHCDSLFLLCLAYAYPHSDCEVIYGKTIARNRLQLNFIEVPADWNITARQIQDYIYPEKQYRIDASGNGCIRVQGSANVLKKFIFPQYFNKNAIGKHLSPLFERLAKSKIHNKFQVEVNHGYSNVVILNESINRILIPPNYEGKYRILTNQLSMTGNRKMAKMTALVPEETHLMMQLIIDKEAEVALHPSREMLDSFKVAGKIHHFSRVIAGKELQAVRRLRSGALRKNNNDIHSNEEVMSLEDIDTLADFIESQEKAEKETQPWEQSFLSLTFGNVHQQFHPLSYPFEFNPQITYFQRYQQWKKSQYYSFINNYRKLVLTELYIICGQCKHLEPLERLSLYTHQDHRLQLNQYSGSWETNNQQLLCPEGHHVGDLKNTEEALLLVDQLKVYIPSGRIEPFWKEWPSPEDIKEMNERAGRQVSRAREELEEFQCPFCFDKKQQHQSVFLQRDGGKQSFWKKLQGHFGSHQHTDSMFKLKKSIRRK